MDTYRYNNSDSDVMMKVIHIPKGLTDADYEKIANEIENEFEIACFYDEIIHFKPNEIYHTCPLGTYIVQDNVEQHAIKTVDWWTEKSFKENFTMVKPPKMRELDWSKPLQTKEDKLRARKISEDGPKDKPMVCVIQDYDGEREWVYTFTVDGHNEIGIETDIDLENVPDTPESAFNDGIQKAIDLVNEYDNNTISIDQLLNKLEKSKKPINH